MAKFAARKERAQKQPPVRPGRPPQKLAGEVDDRILDAARRVFLERGLGGASVEEIARLAHAGKTSIYARFPSKEALFAAVGMRNSAKVVARFQDHVPAGKTVEERLVSVGKTILENFLVSEVIDFMRLSVAEARRIPDLANFGRAARERATQAVSQALSEVAHSEETVMLPAFRPENLEATTRLFLDLAVGPLLLRALLGDDLGALRAEIGPHVARSVAYFLAACRNSGAN